MVIVADLLIKDCLISLIILFNLGNFVLGSLFFGRSDWLGYWVEFVQKARFKKLACLCHIKQNELTYLGRVCTPCLSVSTGIYDLVKVLFISRKVLLRVKIHKTSIR